MRACTVRAVLIVSALALGACAQTPTRPQPTADTPATETLSDEAKVAFFVHHARAGDLQALAADLDAGINIDSIDTLSQTALIAAVSQNRFDTTKLLLERGANVETADPAGWTPLIHATYAAASLDVLKLLVEHGADINAANDRGVTALYLASSVGREDQVLFLLAHGADPALETSSGYTARRVAQLRGLDRIVALLDAPRTATP